MSSPIALQLYTVREALAQDFDGTMQKIADMGYLGVETARFAFADAQRIANKCAALGLSIIAAHASLPLGESKQDVLDNMAALNCSRLISPWMEPANYQSKENIKRLAETFNEANAVAQANGLTLGIHNHWFEMELVNGVPAYQILREYLEPDIFFEVDTYWVKTAGLDPVATLKDLGPQAPLLHIKDGPCVRDEPMLALGEGLMDFENLIPAHAEHTDWLIVELDHCATDMLEAVSKSYKYLTSKGLGHGKN